MAPKKKIVSSLKTSQISKTGPGKCRPDDFLKKELLEKASDTLKVPPKSLLPLTKPQLCEIIDGKSPSKVSEKAAAAVKKGRPASSAATKVTSVKKVAVTAKKVGKKEVPVKKVAKASTPTIAPMAKCPGGRKKAEIAEAVSKKFKITQEEALRLKVAEMCDSLATSKPPSIPPPKKVRPKYSPEFIVVGSPTRKRKTSKKALSPLRERAATPSPLRFVKMQLGIPKSPKAKAPLPRNVKDLECVRNSKIPLKDYQLRVVNHFQTNRGLIVAHPVGSGKTLEGVTVVACFLNKHPNGVAKIVTPVSLQFNFQKELKAAGVNSDRIEFYTLAAFAKQHATGGEKFGTCSSSSSPRGRPVILVVDEAHELRTNISKARASGKITRAEVAVKCAMEADEVLLLTATAVYNEPYDVAGLVAMAKGTVPLSVKSFESLVNSPDTGRFRDYFACMFSFHDIPRDENYPSVTKGYIEIEMSPQYFKEYKEVERRNSSIFSGKNPFLFLSGVRRASNALSSCPKCDVVMNFVNFGLPLKVDSRGTPTFSTTRPKKPVKIVVFSSFREYGIDKLAERLKAAKIPFGEVQGSMSKEARQKSVDRYNSDQDQVLLITAAGGQGLDLKGTRVMIIFEEQWNKSIEEQVEGRAVRYRSHAHLPESERNVQIYHLIMVKPRSSTDKRPSADVILRNLVEEKGVSNMKFLKRLQEVSIEQMSCGARPISPPKIFSPVKVEKKKKRDAKSKTWDKVLDLAKKFTATQKDYDYDESHGEQSDFSLTVEKGILRFQKFGKRDGGGDGLEFKNSKVYVYNGLFEKPAASYKKGDVIPSELVKIVTLLETLLDEVLFQTKKPKTPSPKKSLVKTFQRAADLVAKLDPKYRIGSFGKTPQFTVSENTVTLFSDVNTKIKTYFIIVNPSYVKISDIKGKSTSLKPSSAVPVEYLKDVKQIEEFLEKILAERAGNKILSPSPVKSPVKNPKDEAFKELFVRAYENIKGRTEDWKDFGSLTRFTEPTFLKKFPDVRHVDKGKMAAGEWLTLTLPDVWSASLLIRTEGTVEVDFVDGSGEFFTFGKSPAKITKRATEALEFLAKLKFHSPSPAKSPVKNFGYAELFVKAYQNIKDRSEWEQVGPFVRFMERTFASNFPEVHIDRGDALDGKWVTMVLGNGWTTSILFRTNGINQVDFHNSRKIVPYGEVPASTIDGATKALMFLSKLKFPSASPVKKSPAKAPISEDSYTKLFETALEHLTTTNSYGDVVWKLFFAEPGMKNQFASNEFKKKYPDALLTMTMGRAQSETQIMTLYENGNKPMGSAWTSTLVMNIGRGGSYADFRLSKVTPFEKVPKATVREFADMLEFLSKLKTSASPTKGSPKAMGAPLIKSPARKTSKVRMSKFDYASLFLEAYENVKEAKNWDTSRERKNLISDAFYQKYPSEIVQSTFNTGYKMLEVSYYFQGEGWTTNLQLGADLRPVINFTDQKGTYFAYEKVPDGVLGAAIERLEFLRELELEYFMDKFYKRMRDNFDRARELYGKKEINWTKIPGTKLEFSFVGKILGIRAKKIGMVTYNGYNKKLIFYDEKDQMQNPYTLGDSQVGKWLPLKDHPVKIQKFFSTMTVAMGELEKYFAVKL